VNTPHNRRILLIDDTPAIHEAFRKWADLQQGIESTLNIVGSVSSKNKKASLPTGLMFHSIGRGGGIRTRDPLHPMQVRYQAALRPDTSCAL